MDHDLLKRLIVNAATDGIQGSKLVRLLLEEIHLEHPPKGLEHIGAEELRGEIARCVADGDIIEMKFITPAGKECCIYFEKHTRFHVASPSLDD